MDSSQICISTSLMYALRSKHLNVSITLQVDSLGPPLNDLHKLSDTQSILMYHSVVKVEKKSRASIFQN